MQSTLAMVAEVDVPAGDDWLSRRERRALARFGMNRRRRDWRAGRWVAKRAVLAALGGAKRAAPSDVEVLAAEDGAPRAWIGGAPARAAVSISHRDGTAISLASRPDVQVGCDVELVEPRASVFADDWFTPAELATVARAGAGARDLLVTAIWSAKESALKAIRRGLQADTRDVDVALSAETEACADGWRPLTATYGGRQLAGWWRREDNRVVTAVIEPAGSPPVMLSCVGNDEEMIR